MTKEDFRKRRADYMRAWTAMNKDRVNAARRERRKIPEVHERILASKLLNYEKNKANILSYQKTYRTENAERIQKRQALWRSENRGLLLAQKREWYKNNKVRHSANAKAWRAANPGWQKKWNNANREHLRELQRNSARKRRAIDPVFRIRASMRSRIWSLIKKAGAHKDASLKVTASELRTHLEGRFKPGMTWDNYGSCWHVDHIKPCALFDFTNGDEVRKCFSLSNLQPLWADENIRKADQYPFEQSAA